MTLQAINSLRSETPIELLWQKAVQQAEVLGITQPSLPRKRKQPVKRLIENETSLYVEVSNAKVFYRHIYFDTIDTVTNCIKIRFSQPRYRAIRNIGQHFKCDKWIRVSK